MCVVYLSIFFLFSDEILKFTSKRNLEIVAFLKWFYFPNKANYFRSQIFATVRYIYIFRAIFISKGTSQYPPPFPKLYRFRFIGESVTIFTPPNAIKVRPNPFSLRALLCTYIKNKKNEKEYSFSIIRMKTEAEEIDFALDDKSPPQQLMKKRGKTNS